MSRFLTIVFAGLIVLAPVGTWAQEPPPAPPADWGPMSINLEDVPYPHPVSYFSFNLEGAGRPDGLHGCGAGRDTERQERRAPARHELLW